ncbi:MAG: DNA methyltransferase [bacterium]
MTISDKAPRSGAHIPEADVSAFIDEHGKPYDPEVDDYRRPPFAAPVKAGKNSAIYRAHSYHTKVPPQGIVPYIKHYTDPADLVLDPFCGSGMTGVACLMTGRHAILNDLSPAATHIAYNYCTPVDVEVLKREFESIQAVVEEEFDWLYSTTCDLCGGPATILYTVWSDVFECNRCGEPLVLWDLAVERQTSKVHREFTCPICGATWRKTDLRWLESVPVVTNYECHGACKDQRHEHSTTKAEKARIAQIEEKEIPYWYPTTPFDESWEMWRASHGDQGITDVSKFFTWRNLWALARVWHEIELVEQQRIRAALRFVFTSLHYKYSRRTKWHKSRFGQSAMPGTLYVPSLTIENNVGWILENKFRNVCAGLSNVPSGDVVVETGSATDLSRVGNQSVDYVFTDPPFGSNIFYADCSLLWEAWLGEITDQTQEAVVHVKHRNKNTLPDYAQLMTESFQEMYRCLKPGRWASVVFHNSDDRIWQVILDAAEEAGFELAEINSFDKKQLSFKGVRGDKGLERVTNQDILLNLYKPGPHQPRIVNDVSRSEDLEAQVVQQVADFLASNPPPDERTLQHIWNHVLYEMIANGTVQVSMADLDHMLPYYFKEVDGRWYLRGEAVVGGHVFDIRSETDAITWLTAVLEHEPKTTGDLIPEWQKATYQAGDAITKSLDQILEENFWPGRRTHRWRIPTPAERERMSARQEVTDRARARKIRRYLAGELELQPTSIELCGWVQFAYEHGMFEEAVRVFANVHQPDVNEELYRKTRKIAQASQMRAGRSDDGSQLRLF